MTEFKGFKTKEEAEKFIKERGNGKLTYYKTNKRTGKPCGVGIDYCNAVWYGGLNQEEYPFCVQWNAKNNS